jgi:predicted dehydrogenase
MKRMTSEERMVRVGVVGLGKMGLSHQAMINAHPHVKVEAVCDATAYVVDMLAKYTGVKGYTDYTKMLDEVPLDAVLIATPSRYHAEMVKTALDRNLHVFCEKPFVLSADEGDALAALATERARVNQVGYHYRFVGAFQEVKRLLDAGVLGEVSHAMAEAYGPVVLRPKGATWRNQRSEGGGCLYDYAAHPINLLNWYFGAAEGVSGTVLNSVFSQETEDEVYGSMHFKNGISAQLSVNWSDESYRKMSTKITIWGTNGRIYADRQEVQVFLRDTAPPPEGYTHGWNVRYTTDLTEPVWFYVRGEEYSAQLDYFVDSIRKGRADNVNSFASAAMTDRVISMLIADSQAGRRTAPAGVEALVTPTREKRRGWFSFAGR